MSYGQQDSTSRHGRRRVVVYATAVIVAAATMTAIFMARPTSAGVQVGSSIPASAISRLTENALKLAKQNGDATPTSIMAVTTTHAKAVSVATPGDTIKQGVSQPVYLVIMEGKFTANVPTPPGAAAPTGSFLSITLDPTTFRLMDIGLSPHAPPVSLHNLGPVTILGK